MTLYWRCPVRHGGAVSLVTRSWCSRDITCMGSMCSPFVVGMQLLWVCWWVELVSRPTGCKVRLWCCGYVDRWDWYLIQLSPMPGNYHCGYVHAQGRLLTRLCAMPRCDSCGHACGQDWLLAWLVKRPGYWPQMLWVHWCVGKSSGVDRGADWLLLLLTHWCVEADIQSGCHFGGLPVPMKDTFWVWWYGNCFG